MEIIKADEFKSNYQLDISSLIETRPGSFEAKYLSWANAQNLLRERHPKLAVDFEKTEAGTPIWEWGNQLYVLPFITDGTNRTPAIFYPVMTNSFDALSDPSVTQINKAMQRATAKAIAVYTGIGLKLYVGEDLVDDKETNKPKFYDQPSEAKDWAEYKMPFGKHGGKTLGQLMEEDPTYVTGYLLSDRFEFKSETFEAACKAAVAATGASAADIKTDTSEVPDEISGQTADPELDEEVPF